jgi:sugar transferase (PEP-CTERM system associated)
MIALLQLNMRYHEDKGSARMIFAAPNRQQPLSLFLAFCDVFFAILVFNLVYFLRLGEWESNALLNWDLVLIVGLLLTALYIFDLNRIKVEMKLGTLFARVFLAVASASIFIVFYIYLKGVEVRGLAGRGILLMSLWGFFFIAFLERWLFWQWLRKSTQDLRWLYVGTFDHLEKFWNEAKYSPLSRQMSCLVEQENSSNTSEIPIVGAWQQLSSLLVKPWSGVVCSGLSQMPAEVSEQLMRARLNGLMVYDLADFYERLWLKIPVYYLRDGWFVFSQGFQLQHFPLGLQLKRILDVIFALLLVILTSPLMLLLLILVRLESRGSAIYRQIRAGENEKPFTILKFRTMRDDAEKNGAQWAVQNDNRITSVGNFLRTTRLDELPQLFNVLRGDMSFVGPRPERPEFNRNLEKEIPYFSLRHLVKPGITGWAQVNYRYGASIEDAKQKLQYDLYYIKNYSLWLDLIIVLRTIRVVLGAKGR